jgi:site-specific DNA recombinase
MENNTKRAVIYCRVSTKEQVEEGNSLITQERNCREYAAKNGYEVACVFIELGESAKTADRTELQKLFSYCASKKNNVEAVIAYKIDRISRNTDDYSQIRILLKRYGIEIKSTSEYFENTPAGRFMENIIANVAQFDNDVRTERSVGGMRQAVMEGRYVWLASLGYSNVRVNGKATIAPNEKAGVIRKAFELIANRTMTVEQTRQYLSKHGISNSYGKPIAKSNMYILLKNPLYMGIIKKLGLEVQGNFEPIISDVLFNRVQDVLKRKSVSREYKIENPDFPLRRFVLAPDGKVLTGCWCQGIRKKYPYYRFPGNGSMFPREKLEDLFASFLNKYAVDISLIERLKEKVVAKLSTASEAKRIWLDEYKAKEQKLKEKQQVLINKNIEGVLPDTIFKEQLSLLNEEMWEVQKCLEEGTERKVDIDFVFTRLSQMLTMPGEYWKKQPFTIKRRLQKFEFPEGVSFDGKIYQTRKVSSIFKLASAISGNISLGVNHLELSIKQSNLTNYPILPDSEIMSLLQEVQSDLTVFDEILKAEKAESNPFTKYQK